MKIGVIGLGKLGLPLALTYASENEGVVAYDHDSSVREAVRARKPHIDEPLVREMLNTACPGVVEHIDEIARYADIIFVVVPTPSTEEGSFSNAYIEDVINALPAYTSGGGGSGKVIAVVSTVSPGSFTGEKSLQTLAAERGYSLAYTPTLIALGSVVHDLIYPDVQMVGIDLSDVITAQQVVRALSTITKRPIVTSDFESVALAKLASNVFVTMKINFANVLAQLCDKLGGDVDDVTKMLGYNQRIGPKSLTAGAGYGGPCFPRDADAFAAIDLTSPAGALGVLTQRLNTRHLNYVVATVRSFAITDEMTFAVVGRSYKDDSPYEIESFGDKLVERLSRYFTDVDAHEADVVVVAQPLRNYSLSNVVKSGAIVYDLWRTHGYIAKREDVTYVALGRGDTSA